MILGIAIYWFTDDDSGAREDFITSFPNQVVGTNFSHDLFSPVTWLLIMD